MDAEETAVSKKTLEKDTSSESPVAGDLKNKTGDGVESKPRIVLTFRSEKSGAKSNNMKIVSSEEKREEISPRRSTRTRAPRYESDEDFEVTLSPRKHQALSDNDASSDSHSTKRSTRCKSKESEGSAKKDNTVQETPVQTRLSRRIKPTAKVLANEELRIGLESQNNARLGVQQEQSPENSKRPRRERSYKGHYALEVPAFTTKNKPQKKKKKEENKLNHLCKLGLKAVDSDSKLDESKEKEDGTELIEIDDNDDEEEIDDDTEVISKLLEDDSCDEDFVCSDTSQQEVVKRRTTRQRSTYVQNDSDGSIVHGDDEHSAPQRRSTRIRKCVTSTDDDWYREIERTQQVSKKMRNSASQPEASSEPEDEEKISNPASAEEGTEASGPPEELPVVATCTCETPSNVYADPDELTEPVFCQAIELVEGVRVGCSHPGRRSPGGSLQALVRAGPRSPYFLSCDLHVQQLAEHMCCPACGLFCTEGIFYQCSQGHLFHLECGLPYNDSKAKTGCPHCGVRSYVWQPIQQNCVKVNVRMTCTNKRIYLPDQREHCTPAYLSFAPGPKPTEGPLIPKELLPSPPIDLKDIYKQDSQPLDGNVEDICQSIVDKECVELLIPQIMSVSTESLSKPSEMPLLSGGTCAHAAAKFGHLAALYLLQYAGADLDVLDGTGKTPLMVAVLALLEKDVQYPKITKKTTEKVQTEEKVVKKETSEEVGEVKESEVKVEAKVEECNEKISEETVDDKIDEQNDTEVSESVEEKLEETIEEKLEESVDENKVKEVDLKKECDEIEMEIDENVEEDSVMHKPSEEELLKVIRYLVAAGCNVNLRGPEDMTALHMAAQHGGAEVCKILLSNVTADVDSKDQGGWTPLVWAAENCHEDVVRLLVEKGADPSIADKEGNSAIHWCALGGHSSVLQLLLEAKPDAIHHHNDHHDTPLHIAARQGHYACVVVLLARGAKTDIENSSGELPVEVCSGQCQAAIALNMQMSMMVQDKFARRKLLSSDISRGRESYPIPCINEVDDEPLPDFTYVTSHVMPTHITIDNTTKSLQGCTCSEGNCSSTSCSCVCLGVRNWSSEGRLAAGFPYHDPPMLFHCNELCGCDLKKCTNSTLLKSLKLGSMFVRSVVKRLVGARGWGLFTSQRVPRGAPVAVYVGELVTAEEADTRSDDHYMFALDINHDLLEQCIEKTQLCIDASKFGGAARMMNHSCRGALAAVRVFTATRDLRVPHVMLAATRELAPGEQLTFDYGDKFWAVKSKWMKCECGEACCRYPAIVNEDMDASVN